MNRKSPRVAVVLGGGGLKPFAALPLFTFLESNKIPIDLLVGCSGGSIVVSLLASGFSPDRILKEIVPGIKRSMFRINVRSVLSVAKLPYGKLNRESAFVRPEPIQKAMHRFFGERRLEDLPVKTILQATNFQTGEAVALRCGLLADCVYASSAIYPLLPPLKIGKRWLFDGTFSAPVPVLQTTNEKVDIVIMVDFLEKLLPDPNGIFDGIMHTSMINIKAITSSQMALAIDMMHSELVYMKVEFERYISFWETDKLPMILESGEKALDRVKDDLLVIYNHKCSAIENVRSSHS
jgi:NTE family protein